MHQSEKTKSFIREVNNLVELGEVKDYATIVRALDWDETLMSNVRNGRRNVPPDIYKKFTKIYNIEETNPINNKLNVESRLLRIEATLEILTIQQAMTKAKNKEDFPQQFSELQRLIEEAYRRRVIV